MNTAENIVIDYSKRLPEAEYEVMNAIWNGVPPLNTAYLMEAVGKEKGWKAPTLISFLVRLQDRGYVTSEKKGKERYYTPVAEKDEYIRNITAQFIEKYHGGSFVNLLDTLYSNQNLSEGDIDDLLIWLKTKC
ncbi:MAG: BlaI/MecI/CopY family transcriptional regulator [Ruminococcaceae bacterium]|nr:BlaI/MecI/CopY family transcriptional regulator [Oscillospiraceae bacterium]